MEGGPQREGPCSRFSLRLQGCSNSSSTNNSSSNSNKGMDRGMGVGMGRGGVGFSIRGLERGKLLGPEPSRSAPGMEWNGKGKGDKDEPVTVMKDDCGQTWSRGWGLGGHAQWSCMSRALPPSPSPSPLVMVIMTGPERVRSVGRVGRSHAVTVFDNPCYSTTAMLSLEQASEPVCLLLFLLVRSPHLHALVFIDVRSFSLREFGNVVVVKEELRLRCGCRCRCSCRCR